MNLWGSVREKEYIGRPRNYQFEGWRILEQLSRTCLPLTDCAALCRNVGTCKITPYTVEHRTGPGSLTLTMWYPETDLCYGVMVIARVEGGRVRSVNSLGVSHLPGSSPVERCGLWFDSRPWPPLFVCITKYGYKDPLK
jgi:hypothetical protein